MHEVPIQTGSICLCHDEGICSHLVMEWAKEISNQTVVSNLLDQAKLLLVNLIFFLHKNIICADTNFCEFQESSIIDPQALNDWIECVIVHDTS